MAEREFSEYQKKVIRRFYENRDQADEQQLAELASNLYLSSGKKLARCWEQAKGILERMRVPKSRIDHILKSQDPALIAEIVKEIEAGTLKRDPKPEGTS